MLHKKVLGRYARKNKVNEMSPRERAYAVWVDMKARCDDPSHPNYPEEGGRGITYDPRWADFEVFYADMGPPPSRAQHRSIQ